MNPHVTKLIRTLQLGNYLIWVGKAGRSHALPITTKQKETFKKEILQECGDDDRPSIRFVESGHYIVSKDAYGYVTDIIPATQSEIRTFIISILGA